MIPASRDATRRSFTRPSRPRMRSISTSPYGTNLVAPALLIGLFALGANHAFRYPKYFSMLPAGPTPRQSFTEGFFDVAVAQDPKPQRVAIAAEDAEFSRNAADGARENVQKYGLKTVYDKNFPPNTTDFSPIIRAIQATNPELVVIPPNCPSSPTGRRSRR